MARPSIQVEGLKELQTAIRQAQDAELGKQLRDANKTIARRVVELALPHVPRRRGRLAASVKALATQRSASVKAGSPSLVPYATVQHWGWPKHGIEAKPFLKDAADAVERDATDIYADALQHITDQLSAE